MAKNLSTYSDKGGKLTATKEDGFGVVAIKQVESGITSVIIIDSRETRLLIDELTELLKEIS